MPRAASPGSVRRRHRAGSSGRPGTGGSSGGRGRRRRWRGPRPPPPPRRGSRALPDHFAEEALRTEDQNQDEDGEGEDVLVLGAEGTAGEQRQVGGRERLQKPEHDPPQHRAWDIADAAEHGRRERLQAGNEPRVWVDEAVLHYEQDTVRDAQRTAVDALVREE